MQRPNGDVITNTFADDGIRRSKNVKGTLTEYTLDEMNTLLETDDVGAFKNRYITYPDNYAALSS